MLVQSYKAPWRPYVTLLLYTNNLHFNYNFPFRLFTTFTVQHYVRIMDVIRKIFIFKEDYVILYEFATSISKLTKLDRCFSITVNMYILISYYFLIKNICVTFNIAKNHWSILFCVEKGGQYKNFSWIHHLTNNQKQITRTTKKLDRHRTAILRENLIREDRRLFAIGHKSRRHKKASEEKLSGPVSLSGREVCPGTRRNGTYNFARWNDKFRVQFMIQVMMCICLKVCWFGLVIVFHSASHL